MKSLFAAISIVGATSLVLISPVQAASVTVSSVAGYSNSTPAVIDFEDGPANYIFDDSLAGYDWSGDAVVVPPPTTGDHAVPFGDNSNFYMSVPGGGSETLTVNTALLNTTGLSSLSLFIGSLDSFNSITFFSGPNFVTLSGTDLLNSIPTPIGDSGLQASDETNRYFTFTFDTSFPVTSIEFDSSADSFEFDNLNPASVTALGGGPGVPEPATWVVLLTGFGLLGLALRARIFGGFPGSV